MAGYNLSCFYCKHFTRLDSDIDYCLLHDTVVNFYTEPCCDFEYYNDDDNPYI